MLPTNTEGLSLSLIVGDCGGREVEQEEKKKKKKKTLNGFACLVSHSSRGVGVCDDKQMHAPFLPVRVRSQATAPPETLL